MAVNKGVFLISVTKKNFEIENDRIETNELQLCYKTNEFGFLHGRVQCSMNVLP